jgi:zinc ribbon protein
MTCPNCDKAVPAGARYCTHCGAEQDLPTTPIAAVAAAMASRGRRREAANAAQAEPLPEVAANGSLGGAAMAMPHPAFGPSVVDRLNAPAYAAGPARHGLALALIAGCLVFGVVGVGTAWWFHAGPIAGWQAATPPLEAALPSIATPAKPNAEPAPSTMAEAPSAATAEPAAPVTSADAAAAPGNANDATANDDASPGAAGPVEITPLPLHRAPPHVARNAVPPSEPRPAPAPVERPAPAPPTKHVAAAAATPALAAPVSDRWTRMEHEMSQCTREDFIARVICSQRVRFRYCDGYWGKVAACPGSSALERGQ